jgi:hypothetical protein
MSRRRLSLVAVFCSGALLSALLAGGAGAALVAVNSLVLRADGGFQPHELPRKRFAPIDFEGHFDISAKGGGQPVALQQAVIDFDRDGHLDVTGLPSCRPEQVSAASTAEARKVCARAIVGTGHIEAIIATETGPVPASSLLTIFNGPEVEGHPTAILHARTTFPALQTYAILAPIERIPGAFRYRVTLDVPPLAGGLGSISHVDVDIGRHYKAGGKTRSYVSARCSDGILDTHGRFTFADGTIIDGSVEKACSVK